MERFFNKTWGKSSYAVGDEIRKLHERLFVVDLHADSLLWNRDLLRRSNVGHIDLPRLLEGNVALQVFGVATGFPWEYKLGKLLFEVDLISLLAMINHWHPQAWRSPFWRAVRQAKRLEGFVGRSNGKLIFIKSKGDLNRFLELRKTQQVVGSMLSLEGAHALQGDISKLRNLYDLGFRIFGISHFTDNEAGGSAHGKEKGGLSAFGHRLLEMVQDSRMIVDLAHASPRVIDEVTTTTKVPVIASHTGVCGVCDNPRNLTDKQIIKIAKTGGVVGITMFEIAICGKEVEDIIRSIRHVINLVGIEHVAIGSDFDGAVVTPFDAGGFPLLTAELLAEGFDEDQVAKIMGGNALHLIQETLIE